MTIFATASDVWPILGIGALALAACALPALLAWCTIEGKWIAARIPRPGRIAAATAIVLAGAPLYLWTFFVLAVGFGAFGGCAGENCP